MIQYIKYFDGEYLFEKLFSHLNFNKNTKQNLLTSLNKKSYKLKKEIKKKCLLSKTDVDILFDEAFLEWGQTRKKCHLSPIANSKQI